MNKKKPIIEIIRSKRGFDYMSTSSNSFSISEEKKNEDDLLNEYIIDLARKSPLIIKKEDILEHKNKFHTQDLSSHELCPDKDQYGSNEEYQRAYQAFKEEIANEKSPTFNYQVSYGHIFQALKALDEEKNDRPLKELILKAREANLSELQEEALAELKMLALPIDLKLKDTQDEKKRSKVSGKVLWEKILRTLHNKGEKIGTKVKRFTPEGDPTIYWEEITGKGISTLNEEHKKYFEGVSLFDHYRNRLKAESTYGLAPIPFDQWLSAYMKSIPSPREHALLTNAQQFKAFYESNRSNMVYLRTKERLAGFEVKMNNGLLYYNKNSANPQIKAEWTIANTPDLKQTDIRGKGVLIFAFDVATGKLYAAQPQPGVFHHSSFLGTHKRAICGSFTIEDGKITSIANDSGHYRNPESDFQCLLAVLKNQGVLDLKELNIYRSTLTKPKPAAGYTKEELYTLSIDPRKHIEYKDPIKINAFIHEGQKYLPLLEKQQNVKQKVEEKEINFIEPLSADLASPLSVGSLFSPIQESPPPLEKASSNDNVFASPKTTSPESTNFGVASFFSPEEKEEKKESPLDILPLEVRLHNRQLDLEEKLLRTGRNAYGNFTRGRKIQEATFIKDLLADLQKDDKPDLKEALARRKVYDKRYYTAIKGKETKELLNEIEPIKKLFRFR